MKKEKGVKNYLNYNNFVNSMKWCFNGKKKFYFSALIIMSIYFIFILFFNISNEGIYFVGLSSIRNIVPLIGFSTAGESIIINNGGSGFEDGPSEANFITSTNIYHWADTYNGDYRRNQASYSNDFCIWTPNIPETGMYEVYEWHGKGGNRWSNSPQTLMVKYEGGSKSFSFDYSSTTTTSGRWNLLGKFKFVAGISGNVKQTNSQNFDPMACDAIKFVFIEETTSGGESEESTGGESEESTGGIDPGVAMTCSQQGGFLCSSNQFCSGDFVLGIANCCSVLCINKGDEMIFDEEFFTKTTPAESWNKWTSHSYSSMPSYNNDAIRTQSPTAIAWIKVPDGIFDVLTYALSPGWSSIEGFRAKIIHSDGEEIVDFNIRTANTPNFVNLGNGPYNFENGRGRIELTKIPGTTSGNWLWIDAFKIIKSEIIDDGLFISTCLQGEIRNCVTGLSGVCSVGVQTCGLDGNWAVCLPSEQGSIEICNDELDNDCDGITDENCQTCNPTGLEICDGIDNDCDGSIDEGLDCNQIIIEGSIPITSYSIVDVGRDYIKIRWDTTEETKPFVRYGELSVNEWFMEYDNNLAGLENYVNLKGLKPGTNYLIQLGGNSQSGNIYLSDEISINTLQDNNIENLDVSFNINDYSHDYFNNLRGASIIDSGVAGNAIDPVPSAEALVLNDPRFNVIDSIRIGTGFSDARARWDSSLNYRFYTEDARGNPVYDFSVMDSIYDVVFNAQNINNILIDVSGVPIDMANFRLRGTCSVSNRGTIVTVNNARDNNGVVYPMNQNWGQTEYAYLYPNGPRDFTRPFKFGLWFEEDNLDEINWIQGPLTDNTVTLSQSYQSTRTNRPCQIFTWNDWGGLRGDKPKDYQKYEQMVHDFFVHMIQRYGLNEFMDKVYIEGQNEPDLQQQYGGRFWSNYHQVPNCITGKDCINWNEFAIFFNHARNGVRSAIVSQGGNPDNIPVMPAAFAGFPDIENIQPIINVNPIISPAPFSYHQYGMNKHQHIQRKEWLDRNWGWGAPALGSIIPEIGTGIYKHHRSEFGPNFLPFRPDFQMSKYSVSNIITNLIYEDDLSLQNPDKKDFIVYYHGLVSSFRHDYGLINGLDFWDNPKGSNFVITTPGYGAYVMSNMLDGGQVVRKTYNYNGQTSTNSVDNVADQKRADALTVYDSFNNKVYVLLASHVDYLWRNSDPQCNPNNNQRCLDFEGFDRILKTKLNIQGLSNTPLKTTIYTVHDTYETWIDILGGQPASGVNPAYPNTWEFVFTEDQKSLMQRLSDGLEKREYIGFIDEFYVPAQDVVLVEYSLSQGNNLCGNGVIDTGEQCGEPGLSCQQGQTCSQCNCISINNPPTMSNGRPRGNINTIFTTDLQVTTNVPSDCRYSTSNIVYSQMRNTFSTTGSTSHSSNIPVLPGRSYQYYVHCRDVSNQATTQTPLQISFNVDPIILSTRIFAGGQTNLPTDPWNPFRFALERVNHGSLTLQEDTTIRRSVDIDTYVNFEKRANEYYVDVNAEQTGIPEIGNKVVDFLFYDVEFRQPIFYHNGQLCIRDCTTPRRIGTTNTYTVTSSRGFSTYSLRNACVDGDLDGFYVDNSLCSASEYDCDDNNFNINPGVTEICDGIDNNCDGNIDETCQCDPGEEQTCSLQVGVCLGSLQVCNQNSQWPGCNYLEYNPLYQLNELACDGIDNDCDGTADNIATPELCENQNGVCAGATKTCGGTAGWSSCTIRNYQTHSTFHRDIEHDMCDGLDNDCDGNIDEGCSSRRSGNNLLLGREGSITSNHQALRLHINGERRGEANINSGSGNVEFKLEDDNGNSILEWRYYFGENDFCDLSYITLIKQDSSATRGEFLSHGVCLNSGHKKTIYVDKISGTNNVCIKDAEIIDLSSISADCTGENEFLIQCDGVRYGEYICTDLVDKYKVSGISNSFVVEHSGSSPSPSGDQSSGSSSGSGGERGRGSSGRVSILTDVPPTNAVGTTTSKECQIGETQECGTKVGECSLGQQVCDNGEWSKCLNSIGPKPEKRDKKDNDCDGEIDEGTSINLFPYYMMGIAILLVVVLIVVFLSKRKVHKNRKKHKNRKTKHRSSK